MVTIPAETARRYTEIFGKLLEAKNPAMMLKELKENGFKYISEDFQLVIDQYISEENKLIIGLMLANPQSKPENIGIPRLKSNIKRALMVKGLFDKQMNYNAKNQIIADSFDTWKKNKFLNKFIAFLQIIDHLYIREEVTDDMIDDFLKGFPLLPKSIIENNEILGAEIDNLIKPVMEKIMLYLNTDYLKYNTIKNIDTGEGLEKITFEGWEIPITPAKIIRYIKETNSSFISGVNINEAKHGFIEKQKVKAKQHSVNKIYNEAKNNTQMDYLEIVLAGTIDENTRHFLPEYFFREFKKAEKEFFGSREFFNGLLSIIDSFEEEIKYRFNKRKNELLLMKSAAENRTIKYGEDNNMNTYEQRCIDTIGYCDNELKNLKIEFFNAYIPGITNNKYSGNLPYNHVLFIKKAIREAMQKVLDSQNPGTDTFEPIVIENQGIEKLSEQDRAILIENSKKFVSQMQSYTNKYPAMSIEKWLNEVQPFESIKDFYSQLEQTILKDIADQRISYKDSISILELLKLSYSEPQNVHAKTLEISQLHINFLQNIIGKLSVLSSLVIHNSEDLPKHRKKVPDKWYALLHMILIVLSKESQFTDSSKKGIIDLGFTKYGTGQGFYKEIRNIDLNNIPTYIKCMSQKDRNKWKSIIIELSSNDADIILWVKKQPK